MAQVLLGFSREHRWLRFAYGRLGRLFPHLPKQPGYKKRLRRAEPLLRRAIPHIACQAPSWFYQLWLVDSTPLLCAASRRTVQRSDLAGRPATATAPATAGSSGVSGST